ncbi:hypothetical protein J5N97_017148 [Dioscorea zingiberensis]|uniref:Transmembrane protein n=1 Tax=Dioscorea zingiberensis TaxID=325984 RepID=A0A9D5HGA2_9LILI|nr:hypothetical protein J5N97_017148 [Dioscorea zingiberensis]
MSRLPPPRPFAAAFHHTPCVLAHKHRIAEARSPTAALRGSQSLTVLPFSSLSLDPPTLTSAIGYPPSSSLVNSKWSLERRHIRLLNLIACSAAISTAWLFFSAIPALLAFKKSAESLEGLLDVTTEELPDAMAAVRLSGMEICDLTMELSDLGQGIAQGVRRSTQAVRIAEDRLHRFSMLAPTVSIQAQATSSINVETPMVAKTAKNLREGIAKSRSVFGVLVSIAKLSRWVLNFSAQRRKKQLSI